jgi:hypothetical protein
VFFTAKGKQRIKWMKTGRRMKARKENECGMQNESEETE